MLDALNPKTLQKAREAAKLSRAQLALRSGVSETTILRIETGKVDPRTTSTWAPIVREVLAAKSQIEVAGKAVA